MRSSPAAWLGLVAIVVSVSVTLGEPDLGVTYTPTKICASKGSTVEINCTFRYPPTGEGLNTTVEQTFWFRNLKDGVPVDLRRQPEYAGRVGYQCAEESCTLTITDLRESDSAEYKFRFITNQPDGMFTGNPGVSLTVTGLQVQITKTTSCKVQSCIWSMMTCQSRCLPQQSSYIWYNNGNQISERNPYSDYFYSAASISCALKGPETFTSPTVCVPSGPCTTVNYDDRHLCAFTGSSVNISCTYTISRAPAGSEFWFRHRATTTWLQDHRGDVEYEGRAELLRTSPRRSTLTIRDLRESDSGEYRFNVGEKSHEWTNRLTGTTLTVRDPHIQVQVIWSLIGPKLICHSSCSLPGRSSYVWYENGTRIQRETSVLYGGVVNDAANYSCAYEGYRSAPVYGPKRPSVSVSPSGEILEGSSVTLTCSTDANPAANYTWYKEGGDSPVASGQNFTISDSTPEHSGNYSCAAQNILGRRQTSTLQLNVAAANTCTMMNIFRLTVVLLMLIPLLVLSVWMRKKKLQSRQSEQNEGVEMMELESGHDYENSVAAVQTEHTEEQH